jgi:diguanylate cyclase (GGDEF)-like protein
VTTTPATRAADQLLRIRDAVRELPAVLGGAVATVVVAAAAHTATGSGEFAWLSAVAIGAMALGRPRVAFVLTAGAGILHAAVDITVGGFWVLDPLIRAAGLVLVAFAGVGTSGLTERYHESHNRSLNEDPVTGLLNVRAFYDGLAELHADGVIYSILLADIAGMRNLNERYGHPTGTEAMRALGHVLRRSTKASDLVARLGSDEVAVALVGADRRGALAAARRLSRLLADESITLPDGRRFQVHAHYGIATSEAVADEVAMLRAADRAKHAAKEHGTDEIGVVEEVDTAPDFVPAAESRPSAIPKKSDGVWAD